MRKQPPSHKHEWVSPTQLAVELNMTPQLIYGAISRGQLRSVSERPKLICRVCAMVYFHFDLPSEESPEELLASPIQAYRGWVVNFIPSTYYNVTGRYYEAPTFLLRGRYGMDWLPGQKVAAKCDVHGSRGRHTPPGPDCRCGYYAVSDPFDPQLAPMRAGSGTLEVFGAVDLYGRYMKHQKGWKAQYADITALLVEPPSYGNDDEYFRYKMVLEILSIDFKVPLVHSRKLLGEINWGEVKNEYREEGKGWGSNATSGGDPNRSSGRGAIRNGAGTIRSLEALRGLYQEGMISLEAVRRILEGKDF